METPCGLLLLSGLLLAGPGTSADIATFGAWSPTINTTNYRTVIDSTVESLWIHIDAGSTEDWTVKVVFSTANLPTGLTLSVKRLATGGCEGLTGGTSYLQVSGSPVQFFSGRGTCHNIGVQMQFNGIAAGQPAPAMGGATVQYSF